MMILGTIIAACIGGALGYCASHTKEMHDDANEIRKAGTEIVNMMDDSFTEMNKEFDSLSEVKYPILEIKAEDRTDEQKDILKKTVRSQYRIIARMVVMLMAGVPSAFVCVVASFILHIAAICLDIIAIPFNIIFKIVDMIINKVDKKLVTEEPKEPEESEVTADAVDCEYCTEG